MDAKNLIACRVAQELKDGDVVNLGIGLPTLIPDYLPAGISITLQSENGFLGLGPLVGEPLPNLVNAGGKPCGMVPGTAFFDSAMSFAIIRGGHVDVTVLGGLAGRPGRQPRQLDGARQDGAGHGRRDGPRDRRARTSSSPWSTRPRTAAPRSSSAATCR